MKTLAKILICFIIHTLPFICYSQKTLKGDWKIIEYSLLDSNERVTSSFKLKSNQSIEKFLLNEIKKTPITREIDSLVNLIKANVLVLGEGSRYKYKGLGLLLPSKKEGFEFDSTISGKWKHFNDILSLSLDQIFYLDFSIIHQTQNTLTLKLLIKNAPFNKVILMRQ